MAALRFCVLNTKNANVKKGATEKRLVDPRKKREWIMLGIGACVICLLLWLASLAIGGEGTVTAQSGVRILRAMSSNSSTCLPVEGQYLDWVELVNLSDAPVSLKGWRLSSGDDIREACVFPDVTLQSGESTVVYAGDRPAGADADLLFASFTLNADGDSLALYDENNALCDSVELPAMAAGKVYALDAQENAYSVCSPYDDLGVGIDLSAELIPAAESGLVISELMAVNGSTLLDADGVYSDWIEIYNGTGADVDLAGYSLSEDEVNRRRYVFPNTTLAAGEYLLVFASGGERSGDELHAAFKLSSEGECVTLFNAKGIALSSIEYQNLDADESVVRREDGSVQRTFSVSPGYPNTDDGAHSAVASAFLVPMPNAQGIYINEVASGVDDTCDWVEIINTTSQTVDVSGYGLSDNPNRPRKWQFPAGTTLPANGGVVVSLVGSDGDSSAAISRYVANFAISASEDESLVLADAQGNVIDQMLVSTVRRNVSYGRMPGETSYVYFTSPTPGAANGGSYYRHCAKEVEFSQPGGVQDGPVILELSAEPGMAIYYTLDGSEPTAASAVYTGPITLSSNTVVKAIAWSSSSIPSYSTANTYLFGISHTTPIVCVSGNPEQLTGENGTLMTGKIGSGYDVYAEFYDEDGNQLVSQGCMLKVNGRSSRTMYNQRAFRLVAKNEYGDNRFHAELFENRDYDEYKAVVVRAAGQDNQIAYMRDVIFTSRARNTSVMYQESETVVAYVNAQYWGVYHLRERISPESICQFEGWVNPDVVDLLEGDGATVVQGSNKEFKQMIKAVEKYGVSSDENLAALRTMMDVENYLEYVMLQIYCNNQDLNNVRVYRNTEEDGLWRWILFDTDLGMRSTHDAVEKWCTSKGEVGTITSQSNTLFLALMQNESVRGWFLTRFGELLATDLNSDAVIADMQQVYKELQPEMQMHCARWDWSVSKWQNGVEELAKTVETQTSEIIASLIKHFKLNEEQAQHYFGVAMAQEGM